MVRMGFAANSLSSALVLMPMGTHLRGLTKGATAYRSTCSTVDVPAPLTFVPQASKVGTVFSQQRLLPSLVCASFFALCPSATTLTFGLHKNLHFFLRSTSSLYTWPRLHYPEVATMTKYTPTLYIPPANIQILSSPLTIEGCHKRS